MNDNYKQLIDKIIADARKEVAEGRFDTFDEAVAERIAEISGHDETTAYVEAINRGLGNDAENRSIPLDKLYSMIEADIEGVC